MIVRISAIFKIIQVIDAVLVIGHQVAHIRLPRAVLFRQEKSFIFICRFLAAGRAQIGKILIAFGINDFSSYIRNPTCIQYESPGNRILFEIPRFGGIFICEPTQESIPLPFRLFGFSNFSSVFYRLPVRDLVKRKIIVRKTDGILRVALLPRARASRK